MKKFVLYLCAGAVLIATFFFVLNSQSQPQPQLQLQVKTHPRSATQELRSEWEVTSTDIQYVEVVSEPVYSNLSTAVRPKTPSIKKPVPPRVSQWEDGWNFFPDSTDQEEGALLMYQLVLVSHETERQFRDGSFPMNEHLREEDRLAIQMLGRFFAETEKANKYQCYLLFGKNMADHTVTLEKIEGHIPLAKTRTDDPFPHVSYVIDTAKGALFTPLGMIILPPLRHYIQEGLDDSSPRSPLVFDYLAGVFVVPPFLIVQMPVQNFSENKWRVRQESEGRAGILKNKTEMSFPLELNSGEYFWTWVVVRGSQDNQEVKVWLRQDRGEKAYQVKLTPVAEKAGTGK